MLFTYLCNHVVRTSCNDNQIKRNECNDDDDMCKDKDVTSN